MTLVGLPIALPTLGVNGAALVSMLAYSTRGLVAAWLTYGGGRTLDHAPRDVAAP